MKKICPVLSFLCLIIFIAISSSFAQNKATQRPTKLSDDELLELVQKQTLRYFWDFGHPVSGMARERSNVAFDYGGEVVTTGGTGFGLMAIIIAAERKWITRQQAAERVLKIVNFLWKSDSFHGVFPHWLNGETGKVIRFSQKGFPSSILSTCATRTGSRCPSRAPRP